MTSLIARLLQALVNFKRSLSRLLWPEEVIAVPSTVRALFILKLREDYSEEYAGKHLATGMYNSAKLVSDMLKSSGVSSSVVIVNDNNDIDREVTKARATHVFIEGIWVVPEKFEVLKRLHPTVSWIIRCHSELPFLAQEGNAIDWIFEYVKQGVRVSGNSPRVNSALQSLVGDALGISPAELASLIPELPNYYPISKLKKLELSDCARKVNTKFDIGCFGAIRPLKNQLIQAIAAVEFAKERNAGLHFHINADRVEQNGANQLKNLRALFKQLGDAYGDGENGFRLVEHPWLDSRAFKKLLGKMDICMQVSMSETFNIVTADAISVNKPTVVSPEVTWSAPETFAAPTCVDEIAKRLCFVWRHRCYVIEKTKIALCRYSARSKGRWLEYLSKY